MTTPALGKTLSRELKEAARAFTKAVFEHYREQSSFLSLLTGPVKMVLELDPAFGIVQGYQPDPVVRYWTGSNSIYLDWKETEELEAALKTDSVANSHLEKLVGTPGFGFRRVDLLAVIERLDSVAWGMSAFEWSDNTFNAAFDAIESFFCRETFITRAFGFFENTWGRELHIDLPDGVTLRSVKIGEFIETWNALTSLQELFDVHDVVDHQEKEFIIVERCEERQKIITEAPPSKASDVQPFRDILPAILLATGSRVGLSRVYYRCEDNIFLPGSGMVVFAASIHGEAAQHQLTCEDADKISSFYPVIQECSRGRLSFPLRWLVSATRRDNLTDRLVDTVIALESFYLQGCGDEKERGEMRYRLSTRAALFVTENPEERREIKKEVSRIYDARSKIVHGGEPSPSSLDKFEEGARKILLRTLRKYLSEYPNCSAVDWDSLMFGRPSNTIQG